MVAEFAPRPIALLNAFHPAPRFFQKKGWRRPAEFVSNCASPPRYGATGLPAPATNHDSAADGGSSSGRTADSDSASLGSNPSPPANKKTGRHGGRFFRFKSMIYRSLRTLRRMAVRAGVELRRQCTLYQPPNELTGCIVPRRAAASAALAARSMLAGYRPTSHFKGWPVLLLQCPAIKCTVTVILSP